MADSAPGQDHYSVLEIPQNATPADIKTAYRRLARLYHPDKNNGSQTSTLKTQQINAAWEVLGDSVKKIVYDRSWQTPESETNDSRPNTTKSTTPPQWRRQSPSRPTATPENDARARAQSQKKRQAWLKYEKSQEASIRQCRRNIQALKSEITILTAKIERTEEVLTIDVRWRAGTVTDTDELQREVLVATMAIKSKQLQLEDEESCLKRLDLDLLKRRGQEYARLAAERKEERRWQDQEEREEQHRRERLAKERLEAEERKQREAAWEARMNEIRQRARQHTAKQTELADEARQAEAARQTRMAKERTFKEEAQKRKPHEGVDGKAKAKKTCMHETTWDRYPGPFDCTHCSWPPSTFAFRCPDCQLLACLFCMTTLKAGCKPADYKAFWELHAASPPSTPAPRVNPRDDHDDDDKFYDCQDDFDFDSVNNDDYYDCWDYSDNNDEYYYDCGDYPGEGSADN